MTEFSFLGRQGSVLNPMHFCLTFCSKEWCLFFRNTMQTTISRPKRAQTRWPSSRCSRSDFYPRWWDLKPDVQQRGFIWCTGKLFIPFFQIYALWVDSKNYVEVTRRWHAENISFPLNFFLPSRMQNKQLERLRLIRGNASLESGEEAEKEVRR